MEVETKRELDKMPFYCLSEATEGRVISNNENCIAVKIQTGGENRLDGYFILSYRKEGPYDEQNLPYEQFAQDWEKVQ